MRELVLVFGVLAALGAMGAASLFPWQWLMMVGAGMGAAGMLIGVPTAVVYHLLLYQSLARQGEVPKDWIWRPISYNHRVEPWARGPMNVWFYIAGGGFVIVVLAGLIVAAGFVSAGMNPNI